MSGAYPRRMIDRGARRAPRIPERALAAAAALLTAAAFGLVPACGAEPVDYDPGISPSDLSTAVDNPLLPFPVGATWVYEATTDEGTERIEIEVLDETKAVAWGATGIVVRDTVYLDGALIEDTWDWYAQHNDGAVWYLGEETYEYEDGEVKCDCGAWEAGVDGALPGIVMPATPSVGDSYRQEYYAGEAEDRGEVVALDESVTVPAGSFTGCVKIKESSDIDPDLLEYKYFCEGVGLVLVEEDGERVELLEYSGL